MGFYKRASLHHLKGKLTVNKSTHIQKHKKHHIPNIKHKFKLFLHKKGAWQTTKESAWRKSRKRTSILYAHLVLS